MPARHANPLPRTTSLALALGLLAAAAHAGPAVPQGDEIAHTVQEGDTLEGLARAYLDAPRQWPLLQARNKVANTITQCQILKLPMSNPLLYVHRWLLQSSAITSA